MLGAYFSTPYTLRKPSVGRELFDPMAPLAVTCVGFSESMHPNEKKWGNESQREVEDRITCV